MYQINLIKDDEYFNESSRVPLFHPLSKDLLILSGKISLKLNYAGSCTFTIPKTHKEYNNIINYKDAIEVLDDGEEIFSGKIVNVKIDRSGNKTIYCEGYMAFTSDAIWNGGRTQVQIDDGLQAYMTNDLNAQSDMKRWSVILNMKTGDSLSAPSWGNNIRNIQDQVIEAIGGYWQMVIDKNVQEYKLIHNVYPLGMSRKNYTDQIISFGYNLLDINSVFEMADIYTAVCPIGKNNLALGNTIESSIIKNQSFVDKYGIKVAVKKFDECEDRTSLRTAGTNWINSQVELESIQISALDMSMRDVNYNRLKLGYYALAYIPEYGLDGTENTAMLITEKNIDLLSIANSKLTLGMKRNTLTKKMVSTL